MTSRILDAVNKPTDLHVLSTEELEILSQEIREEIVSVTSQTGGHVAPSLGAVDIIVAAHSVMDLPKDKLLFDVGHQSYAHKLLTGRRDAFKTLRTWGGLSGFPKPSESEYDVHPSGHASDSLSIALGMAKARDLNGTDEKIAVLIGDAAIAGGMAFEALNHMGQVSSQMLIILNDNEMSISKNVGGLVQHLGNVRATNQYRKNRDSLQDYMEKMGPIGRALVNAGKGMKESLKQMTLPQTMIFEQLGIVCTAPIDGHDINHLREMMQLCLQADCPILMHVVTKKGKGYGPAEDDPIRFHGVSAYDIETGLSPKKANAVPTYTDVFGQAVLREARADERIITMTAAMLTGTGLQKVKDEIPERCIDTGITEQHAVGMAAGLAIADKKPVVAIYSTFLQRAIDQIITNVALPNLDVVFAIDRAGLVGEDGPTHHGMFDLAYMRMIPGMRICAPSDEAELVHMLHTALALGGPFAVRYPRGSAEGVSVPEVPEVLDLGVSRTVREGDDLAILAFGNMVGQAKGAADILAEQGISARVVDMRWVKPLDREAVRRAAETKLIVTVECGVIDGGAGSAVLEEMENQKVHTPVVTLGVEDQFVHQGKLDLLLNDLGLNAEGIAQSVLKALDANKI